MWSAIVANEPGNKITPVKKTHNNNNNNNKALMVLAVAWAKKYEIIDENIVWYKEKWEKGKVYENTKGKLVWEYKLRQSSSARRPDLTLEDKETKRNMDL